MTLPEPFRWEGEHIGADLPGGARALFTTRRGGVSGGPFASLNLGGRTADDPANVDANRDRVAAATGCARERFLHGRQVHGATVRRVADAPSAARPAAEEDGQATALAGHPALVLTADCLPVVLGADGAVAALHAGWRGLAAGVLAEGVAALRDVGGDGPVHALIGPGAGPCCYEVGPEVHAALGGAPRRAAIDLPAIARAQLERAGVARVDAVGLCTLCAEGLFFSHRRDGGVTGRQAGMAWQA